MICPIPNGPPEIRVLRLATGTVEAVPDPGHPDRPWNTGFRKRAQTGPVWLGYQGFRGDEQADRRNHGGVDKAVCVYPARHYAAWCEELGLPGFGPGAFGENLTLGGIDEDAACVGDVFRIGSARVQVSQPRQPCWKLGRIHGVPDLAARVERNGRTGFYFRVLEHGAVSEGDLLELLERPFPDWTIRRCNEVKHHRKDAVDEARALASVPPLSGSWKDSLWSRGAERC